MKSGSFEIILLVLSIFAGVAAVNSPDNYRSPNQQNQAYPSPYPTPYPSQTIIVTNTNDSGSGSLRQAITDANANGWDKITFATYLAGETINLQSTIVINKNITIDAPALSQKITLSGDSDNDGDGDIVILSISSNKTVTLKNLKFTKGYSASSLSSGAIQNAGNLSIYDIEFNSNTGGQGGAIRNSKTLYIVDSSFTSNTAIEGGAILNNLNANAEIRNSTFSNNIANTTYGAGGAIANIETISIYDSVFTNNTATAGGGAIVNSFGGSLTVSDSTFTGNTTSGDGGVINNLEGTLTIALSTFSNNTANYGGAIIAGKHLQGYVTTTTISESIISNNQASGGGGGIEFDSGTSMSIDKTTISGNTAPAGGGIVNVSGNLLTITNSTISNNTATQSPQPGGILSLFSPVTIRNSTVTGNNHTAVGIQGNTTINNTTIAGNSGYGLEVHNYTLTITNSILANNGNFDCRTQNGATVTTNQNNLIETNSGCGTPASTSDPLLGALADNGGLTQTMALLSGSPAIDAGDNTICAAAPVNNESQNGVTRPQGASCDIGSYELLLTAEIDVTIGGNLKGSYLLSAAESKRVNYAGVDSGPVVVEATDGTDIIAALRDAYYVDGQIESFVQLMGLPGESLSTTYYFPAYNNVTLDGQLRFGNVGIAPTTVTVTIAGVIRGTYPLNPGQAQRVNYVGLDTGPVVVSSSGGVPIIAALRDAYYVDGKLESFAQLMGLPAEKLSTKYYFPAYNNVTLNGQLRVGNVGNSATTVTVTIAGVPRGTYPLDPSQAVRINYVGLDSGPVVVESSGGVPIIAALRDAYFVSGKLVSFVQLMGLPQEQLSTNYNFPAYNNVTLDGQLRFGNVGNSATTVTVTIAGVVRGTYPLNPSQAQRVNYAGLDAGPVVLSSSGGVPIIAALRDAYFVNGVIESFAQLMGLPLEQLSSAYYFPAYNNVTLNGQLRFGVP